MAILVRNCPRCRAQQMTFDVIDYSATQNNFNIELFCRCRSCNQSTIFEAFDFDSNFEFLQRHFQGNVGDLFRIVGHVCIPINDIELCPNHVPLSIKEAFDEACKCRSVSCWNASGTMFRKCIELTCVEIVRDDSFQKMNLHNKINKLYEEKYIDSHIKELAHWIRQDGNDGAHAENLNEQQVEDLLVFSKALLRRLFTDPGEIEEAKRKREVRQKTQSS